MQRLLVQPDQFKLILLMHGARLPPANRTRGNRQFHQSHVADVEADPAAARHQVGLFLRRVQADPDGGDVGDRIDHGLAVLHGHAKGVITGLQHLKGEPGFFLKVQALVGQHGREGVARPVDVIGNGGDVAHRIDLSK
ncbi:hypothetical protein D9M70_511050 [compost metagenome]